MSNVEKQVMPLLPDVARSVFPVLRLLEQRSLTVRPALLPDAHELAGSLVTLDPYYEIGSPNRPLYKAKLRVGENQYRISVERLSQAHFVGALATHRENDPAINYDQAASVLHFIAQELHVDLGRKDPNLLAL